mmetsp:Transcript_59493/g.156735  ORF Transcript_59493/g.156735 Transcript_59493/m.156735 type:complete len:275 (-) Transcript_59493:904-1728(-)
MHCGLEAQGYANTAHTHTYHACSKGRRARLRKDVGPDSQASVTIAVRTKSQHHHVQVAGTPPPPVLCRSRSRPRSYQLDRATTRRTSPYPLPVTPSLISPAIAAAAVAAAAANTSTPLPPPPCRRRVASPPPRRPAYVDADDWHVARVQHVGEPSENLQTFSRLLTLQTDSGFTCFEKRCKPCAASRRVPSDGVRHDAPLGRVAVGRNPCEGGPRSAKHGARRGAYRARGRGSVGAPPDERASDLARGVDRLERFLAHRRLEDLDGELAVAEGR